MKINLQSKIFDVPLHIKKLRIYTPLVVEFKSAYLPSKLEQDEARVLLAETVVVGSGTYHEFEN